jgi:4-carboxymuconolactone decarboxylase
MSDRYKTGWDIFKKIDSEIPERMVENLKDIAPDLGKYLIEFILGDLYTRPGLDYRSREIATIAALTALGNVAPQLKIHRGILKCC